LTVNAVNDAPFISAVPDQTILRNTSTAPIAFTIGDIDSPVASLSVSATSLNTTLLPNANIVLGGSGSNRTVKVFPATNQIGTATVNLSASDGSQSALEQFLLTVIPPPPPFSVRINFQPAGSPVPEGYLADTGAAYGDRGNGFSYGWDARNTTTTKDRNSPLSPDQRYDTFNTMQKGGALRTWEIGLSNGTYTVLIVAGDPTAFDSVYRINVEGSLTVNGTPTANNLWVFGSKTVTVSDGRLTVSNGTGASNNKICFIDIARGGATGGTPQPAVLTLQGRNANGWVQVSLAGQAGRNYVLESSGNLLDWEPVTLLQSTDGSALCIDKSVISSAQRFYRALLAP
jgi:hypothetical protein